MSTTIIIYILLLVIFLIISSLIFRHTVKYSYLSPRFVYVVSFFGIIALTVIIFSIYLLFRVSSLDSGNRVESGVPSGSTDFNF